MIWIFLFYIVAGFFSGSILYSALLPRLFSKVDIVEDSDDHNPGTANVFKLVGPVMGLICLLLDMAKGFFPVFLALTSLDFHRFPFALVMAAPVLGHAFSPFARFHGGKAIATSFGVLLSLCLYSNMVWYLAGVFIFFSIGVTIRPHSCRVIASFLCFLLSCVFVVPIRSFAVGGVIISAIVLAKHLFPREFTLSQVQISLFGRRKFPKHPN